MALGALLACFASLCAVGCQTRFVLEKGPFLRLPDAGGAYRWDTGAADKAAYDYWEHFLYVIGHKADVVHVINMTDPHQPKRLLTQNFNRYQQGLPNAVKVCRRGDGIGYLAVAFESPDLTLRGHVHLYDLLEGAHMQNFLRLKKDIVTTESFDPRAMAWSVDCSHLVVTSEGDPHEVFRNNVRDFIDPNGDVEVLDPSFGFSVVRRSVPISEAKASAAGLRHVFNRCESGTAVNQTSTFKQDLEPTAVHVDNRGIAYIVFQENNGIATLDLNTLSSQYFYLGTKDWSRYAFDGSYEDNGVNLVSRTIRSFYQPGDLVSFELGGKTYLATADTGSIRRYGLTSCTFDESTLGVNLRPTFADGLDPNEAQQLNSQLAALAQIGRLSVSKLRTSTDGWDFVYQGYDFVSMFGGRGFSILDPVNMRRIYDSGDDFEQYFTGASATEADKAMFNAHIANVNSPQSADVDKRSPDRGPTPTAIATGAWDNATQLIVIANGVVGGLYTYSVTSGPTVHFESFIRRGQAGLSWTESYNQNTTDAVGEPGITDLLFIEDQGQKTVVAVSSTAGALSFYTVRRQAT